MFDNDVTVDVDDAADAGRDFLAKEDLVGETVVLQLTEYDADYLGQYGKTARAICDLYVVTGPHAGRVQESWFIFGNMAIQASVIGEGNTSVAVVQSGKSPKGRDWFGLSFGVTPKDHAAAIKAARKATAGQTASTGTDDAVPF